MNDQEEIVSQVPEPTITFKSITDHDILNVVSEENGEVLIQISGYGLQMGFNMQYLRSVQDIEAAVTGIADLFREQIMEAALQHLHQK